MKVISVAFFLIFTSPFLAQDYSVKEQKEIDSLNAVLTNPKSHDTAIIKANLELANYFYLINTDTTIQICEKSLQKSIAINYDRGKAESYGWLGYLMQEQGNISKAINYYNEALELEEQFNDLEGIALYLNNLALIYDTQGDIPKTIEYLNRALKIEKQREDKYGTAYTLYNIGFIFVSQSKLKEATESKDSLLRLALNYFNESLQIRQEIDYERGVSQCYHSIGTVYNLYNKTEKAIAYFNKSLVIEERLNNKNGIATSLISLGNIFWDQGEFSKAYNYALKSYRISDEEGVPRTIKESAYLLSKVYEKQNKGLESLRMYKLFVTMRDSINNRKTQKTTAQQLAKYEYEKQKVIDDAMREKQKALEDVMHSKELAVKQQEKEKREVIIYAIAFGLFLVFGFLIFVFNRLRIIKKQKNVIELQRDKVEKQKNLIEIAHKETEKQKDEIEEQHKEITDSINYAKRIQSAILPPQKIVKEYLPESFILYKPKDIVAGDFYWLENKGDKILFAAADCTGHGVPGAMVSVICNNGLNRSVREHGLTDPGEILDKTREIVIQEFEKSEEDVKDGMDIALCSLRFEVQGSKLKKTTSTKNPSTSNLRPQTIASLQYAGAHNPLWLIRNGEIIETKANKQPIGKFDKQTPFKTHYFNLQKNDSIYIFSDGFVDQFGGEKGKKFKAKAFRELLLSIQGKSMEEQKSIIDKSFENWRGDLEQIDDVCVIGVRI